MPACSKLEGDLGRTEAHPMIERKPSNGGAATRSGMSTDCGKERDAARTSASGNVRRAREPTILARASLRVARRPRGGVAAMLRVTAVAMMTGPTSRLAFCTTPR